MTTRTESELAQFQRFLGACLENGHAALTPEESVVEFRGWQRELELLRQELSAPLQRSTRGEGRELDLERFLRDRRNAG